MSVWRSLSIVHFRIPFNRHLFGLPGLSSTYTTMFIPFFLLLRLLLFLFQSSNSSGSRYGASCGADSGCDQHQKCVNRNCRCNPEERRFWTGEVCAICAKEYTVTTDRCYKSFHELKTWSAARAHCRAQYADLFTWRNNHDEQFIKPMVHKWATLSQFNALWAQIVQATSKKQYLAWAGATIASANPHTTKWMDPDGLKLTLQSSQWCDPTSHAGYHELKEPSLGTKKHPNGTVETEDCVTFIFGASDSDFLCLGDDYCSQKYPFLCEMNAVSMKLATATHHGSNSQSTGDSTAAVINFEEPPPPPPTDNSFGNGGSPSAQAGKGGLLSQTNMLIFAVVGILLVVGAVVGVMLMKKKKSSRSGQPGGQAGVSQGRPSFASSMGSVMDE